MLLILETPAATTGPPKLADLLELLGQRTELTDQAFHDAEHDNVHAPRCPHCGSARTRLLGAYPRFGVP